MMQTTLKSPPGEVGRSESATVTRRRLLRGSLLFAIPLVLAACKGQATGASPTPTIATPLTAQPTPLATVTTAPSIAPAAPTSTSVSRPIVASSPTSAPASTALTPTDSSVDVGEATPPVTEGPYFKPNSPERASLVGSGVVGTPLTLSGQVVSTKGQPIAKALLDFWQADGQGSYDNAGYILRGHQFTDAEGRYQLVTVVPGLYPGRTRHIHVKVQAPNGPILTTQLYFPNEPSTTTDSLFNPKLVVAEQDGPNATKLATFRFVVSAG